MNKPKLNKYLKARLMLGFTQKQLADRLHTSVRQISRWETGQTVVPHPITRHVLNQMLDDANLAQFKV